MRTEWPAPVLLPRCSADIVDVWRADLGDAKPHYGGLLSEDEHARAARIIRAEAGRQWAASRGILRALLAQYLDADPRLLRFELSEDGKPALAPPHAALRFNLSHTRGIALYAIAQQREVGVDVERADRRVDAVRVARRIFGEDEVRRLNALDPAARNREFLRAWVRHEATVKCLGTGIGRHRGEKASWVSELDVGARAFGAVAGSGAPCTLRCWQWPS